MDTGKVLPSVQDMKIEKNHQIGNTEYHGIVSKFKVKKQYLVGDMFKYVNPSCHESQGVLMMISDDYFVTSDQPDHQIVLLSMKTLSFQVMYPHQFEKQIDDGGFEMVGIGTRVGYERTK